MQKTSIILLLLCACVVFVSFGTAAQAGAQFSYTVVDTGQNTCFDYKGVIRCPKSGKFAGQDAAYTGYQPSYHDNGDGTVTDLQTGLMWQKAPAKDKMKQQEAEQYATNLQFAGYSDWRLPTIKELFSLADFNGNMHERIPYIDTDAFDFTYPKRNGRSGGMSQKPSMQGGGGSFHRPPPRGSNDQFGGRPPRGGQMQHGMASNDNGRGGMHMGGQRGEMSGGPGNRDMDAQYTSSTRYVGVTMFDDESYFGFNFADGRIKAYPLRLPKYVLCVRGGNDYGENRFVDAGDGTIHDKATGLTWQKEDSGNAMSWTDALQYAEHLQLAGKDDWRLPNVKELQSIVDYTRAPDAKLASSRTAAIDPIFGVSRTESWFWSSTTHVENKFAYYVAFGQALSAMQRGGKQVNAHGAGAVRSDPKDGSADRWPNGLGPQSDEIRALNFVRCVRGGLTK